MTVVVLTVSCDSDHNSSLRAVPSQDLCTQFLFISEFFDSFRSEKIKKVSLLGGNLLLWSDCTCAKAEQALWKSLEGFEKKTKFYFILKMMAFCLWEITHLLCLVIRNKELQEARLNVLTIPENTISVAEKTIPYFWKNNFLSFYY